MIGIMKLLGPCMAVIFWIRLNFNWCTTHQNSLVKWQIDSGRIHCLNSVVVPAYLKLRHIFWCICYFFGKIELVIPVDNNGRISESTWFRPMTSREKRHTNMYDDWVITKFSVQTDYDTFDFDLYPKNEYTRVRLVFSR